MRNEVDVDILEAKHKNCMWTFMNIGNAETSGRSVERNRGGASHFKFTLRQVYVMRNFHTISIWLTFYLAESEQSHEILWHSPYFRESHDQ